MAIKDTHTKLLLSFFLLSDNSGRFHFSKDSLSLFHIVLNTKTKQALSSFLKLGYLVSVEDSPDMYLLSDKGHLYASLKFPFLRFQQNKAGWDGIWRVISYEIPESKRHIRDRLRREVAGWGLGPWHRSFWITPHPILDEFKALALSSKVEKYIQAFEAKHSIGDQEILLEKVWKISELEKEYKKLFKIWHTILAKETTNKQKLMEIISEYSSVLKNDPGLPKELLPDKWIGNESLQIFKEIKSILQH